MPGLGPQQMDEVTPTARAAPDARTGPSTWGHRRTSLGLVREELTRHVESLLTVLLALVVVGSLLAVGTVHVSVLLVVGAVALLSFTLGCFVETTWSRRLSPPTWVFLGLALYSLLQSIPIPFSWLQHLSPGVATIWRDARYLIGANPQQPASISAEPGASRVEALKWLTYAFVFAVAGQLTRRTGAKRGVAIVVLSALMGGVLTIFHGLFGIEKWLGIYEPQYGHTPWATSPLLNPNNYAGYLNLATYCAVGLAMTGRPPAPRWALGLVAAVLFALSCLTASRGGVLSLLLGVVLVALALREQSRRARRAGAPGVPNWLPLVGAAIVGGVLFILGTNDNIWSQLLDESLGKLRIDVWSMPLVRDFRWFGVGRGAYETVSLAYRELPGLAVYQHAENFVVDWLAEWGIVVSCLAWLGFAWLLRPKRLGFLRHPLPTAALIGIFVLLLQNLVDMGLEIASVGIATSAVLGSLWGGATRDLERRQRLAQDKGGRAGANPLDPMGDAPPLVPRRQRGHATRRGAKRSKKKTARRYTRSQATRAAVTALLTLVLGSGFIIWVARSGQPDLLDQRRLTREAFSVVNWSMPTQIDAFGRQLRQVISRHPGDSYLPLVGAIYAQKTHDNELVWINHVLRRDPLNARAELLLADVLVAHGARKQALSVLRRCVTYEPLLANAIAQRVVRIAQSLDELELSVPDGTAGVTMLNALALFENQPTNRDIHTALLQRALHRQSNSLTTHAIIVDDLIRDLDDPKSPCAGDQRGRCEDSLREHAHFIEAQGPHNLQAVILHARLLVHEGKLLEAASWLSKHCQEFANDTTCVSHFVTVAARVPGPEMLEEAGSAYLALACSTPDSCAGAATWIGDLFMARGNYELALSRFERAANESPAADAWLRVADAALRSGHVNRGHSALIAARRLGAVSDPELEHRFEAARREQLMHQALKH